MTAICCTKCDAVDSWRAIEQQSSIVPVEFHLVDGQIEIEMSPMVEFVREATASTTTAYFCEACGYTLRPESLNELKEASVDEEKEPVVAQPDQPIPHDEKVAAAERDAKLGDIKPVEDALTKFRRVFS